MSKVVTLLMKDALMLVECSPVDMLIAVADEHLCLVVVEVSLTLSMMFLNLSAG